MLLILLMGLCNHVCFIAGIDYRPLRRNVTLSELQATEVLVVNIIQDNITERTEAFEVRIIIPEETQQLGVSLGTPSVLRVTIGDDDCKPLCLCSQAILY